jgi:hypothetical protein
MVVDVEEVGGAKVIVTLFCLGVGGRAPRTVIMSGSAPAGGTSTKRLLRSSLFEVIAVAPGGSLLLSKCRVASETGDRPSVDSFSLSCKKGYDPF